MSLRLKSTRRFAGIGMAMVLAAAMAACDSGQPAGPEAPMDVTPPAVPDIDAAIEPMVWSWESRNLDGWTLSALPVQVSFPEGGGVSIIAPSEPERPDVFMRSPALSLPGREYTQILVDLETIVPGQVPDLAMYYRTELHGESFDFRGAPDDDSLPEAGERRVLTYDMTRLARGGTDWVDSTIIAIRFDLPQGANSHHIVHSIRICDPENCD